MREEFRFPRRCTPPSTRTFPGTREVMINSGLALSPPARVPPRSTPCSAAPFRLGGPGRARRAPVTVNSGWRPLGTPAPAAPYRRSPGDPYRSPGPGTPPRALQPAPQAALALRQGLCRTPLVFLLTPLSSSNTRQNCGEEKYHCDETSERTEPAFREAVWSVTD